MMVRGNARKKITEIQVFALLQVAGPFILQIQIVLFTQTRNKLLFLQNMQENTQEKIQKFTELENEIIKIN